MRKITGFIISLFLIAVVSCNDNQPIAKNSIVGSWHCTESTIYGSRSYLTDIYRLKSDSTQYLLSNFYNISTDDIADVRAKLAAKTLTINPMQAINTGSITMTVKSGKGTVANDFSRIDFDYTIYNGASDITVHAVYTR